MHSDPQISLHETDPLSSSSIGAMIQRLRRVKIGRGVAGIPFSSTRLRTDHLSRAENTDKRRKRTLSGSGVVQFDRQAITAS